MVASVIQRMLKFEAIKSCYARTLIIVTERMRGFAGADILRILREIPVIITSRRPADKVDIDAVIEFPGERKRVVVQIKNPINAANPCQIIKEAETCPRTPLLVVAGSSTVES